MPIFFAIDVGALLEVVDARAARDFVVVAQVVAAEADRLTGAGAVHDQHEMPRLMRSGTPRMNWISLVTSRPSKNTTHGVRARFRVLRVHEVAGQAAALERHFDDLDLDVGELRVAVEAVHALAVDGERLLVLGRAEALGHLVVVARAQVGVRGGMAVAAPCPISRRRRARRRPPSRRRRTTPRRPPAPCP